VATQPGIGTVKDGISEHDHPNTATEELVRHEGIIRMEGAASTKDT
jgi:hypothetical protein